jgi:Dynamin family
MSLPAGRLTGEPVLDAVLGDVDDDLRFLSTLVARLRSRTACVDIKALERALGEVAARLRDPSLYLALVGEFSSGKSSFVNVLLGERLLATSAIANTAAVTAIRQGPERSLAVRFRGDPRELEFPTAELGARLAQFNRRQGTFTEVLRTLTCDEEVAPAVERVTVEHPSSLLGDDIVLLDTPGTNSTDHGHTATAIAAIAEDADAFVVLIPSNAPLGLSLQALLCEHLEPYLHRTTFVVTHMAQVDADERASLLEFIERRLRRELGLEAPLIAPASLGAAMRARASEPAATAEDHEWLHAFEALRRELVARLRHERMVTVAERVIVLLREAMELVEASLRSESAELRERTRALERHPPANLERFCTKERHELVALAQGGAAGARTAVTAAVAAAERAAVDEIHGALNQAGTIQQLDAVLAEASAVVERRVAGAAAAVTPMFKELSSSIRALSTGFDDRFQRHFQGLDRLAGPAFRPRAASVPKVSVSGVSADALALKRRLDQLGRRSATGGAGVGALIGTFIAPGLGTLIGAGIGGLFGSGASASPAERRTTYWAELEPDVRAVFGDLRSRYEAVLERHAAQAAAHLQQHVDHYRSSYAKAIDGLQAAHSAALRELRHQLAQAGRDHAEVDARIAVLRRRQLR